MKTTITGLIRSSPRVLVLGDITPASLAPADPDKPALIPQMHNRITLFPTLSSLAERDPREAGRLLSLLESIYDGRFRRDTAQGTREYIVDTVVIGTLTPEVYENRFLSAMISYGSRFLIFRYTPPDELSRKVSQIFEHAASERVLKVLREDTSSKLTEALDTIARKDIDSVIIPPDLKEDLETLGELLAKLRIIFRQVKYYDSGSGRWITEIEVSQYDVPIRSTLQLKIFAKCNALIRNVPKIVGLPVVDERAVRLAARLALGGSYGTMTQLLLEIARSTTAVSQRALAAILKLSPSTVNRYLKAMHQVGVLLSADPPIIESKYLKVVRKYLAKVPNIAQNGSNGSDEENNDGV